MLLNHVARQLIHLHLWIVRQRCTSETLATQVYQALGLVPLFPPTVRLKISAQTTLDFDMRRKCTKLLRKNVAVAFGRFSGAHEPMSTIEEDARARDIVASWNLALTPGVFMSTTTAKKSNNNRNKTNKTRKNNKDNNQQQWQEQEKEQEPGK